MLQGWNPEDEASWDKAIAWRTLSITTFSMILAFAVWFLVSAIAPKLNDIGFNLSAGQLYWLAALPGLSGGAIRRRGRPGPAARRGAGPRPDRARIELETNPAAAEPRSVPRSRAEEMQPVFATWANALIDAALASAWHERWWGDLRNGAGALDRTRFVAPDRTNTGVTQHPPRPRPARPPLMDAGRR